MRVLLVTDALPPTPRGGLDLHVGELAAALRGRGLEVEVRAIAGSSTDAIGAGGPPGARLRRSFANGRSCRPFEQALAELDPEVVHFHSLQGLHYRMPGLARRRGARVLWTQHDLFSVCQRVHFVDGDGLPCDGPRKGRACGPCYGGLARLLGGAVFPLRTSALLRALEACHVVVAPSDYVRLVLEDNGVAGYRLVTLPPGVPRPDRDATPPPTDAPPRFVFAGDLRADKGADLAVAATASLGRPTMLEVMGGAPAPPASRDVAFEEGLRRAAAAAHVHFSGRYEPGELLGALDGAVALLAPSRARETFGRTANLALLAGVPVVAADHGGLLEQVSEGVNGALFRSGDAGSLAAAMERVVRAGPSLRETRESWPKPADLQTHVSLLIDLYEGSQ